MATFNSTEKKLIEYARKKILQYCKMRKSKGLYDVLFAFVLSESGKIYEGSPLEPNQPQFGFCAERHAIANMVLKETEKAKIKSIFVAGPVPKKSKKSATPCGACRHVIHQFSKSNTTVLCGEFIRNEKDWEMFPRIDKYKTKELYPHPYIPVEWD